MLGEIEALRGMTLDETLPIAERRDAATHLVHMSVAAVVEPKDDDAEVLKLLKPWRRDTEVHAWLADEFAKISKGRSINGYTLPDAKEAVERSWRYRLLRQLIDDTGYPLVKAAAKDALERL